MSRHRVAKPRYPNCRDLTQRHPSNLDSDGSVLSISSMRTLATALLVMVVAATVCCHRSTPKYATRSEVASAMGTLSKQRRYDEAIRLGQDWLTTNTDDSFIHEQIGMVFLQKANVDLPEKMKLLNSASDYFDRSIQIAPKDPLSVFNAAWGFETVGDLSTSSQRCESYSNARAALDLERTLLANELNAGDSRTIALRKASNEAVNRLAGKITRSRC